MSDAFNTVAVSVLGGSLLTSLGFMIAFSSRLTKVETTLANIEKMLDTHIKLPQGTCAYHVEVTNALARQGEQIKSLRTH